ncbi:MAG: ABC transporter permease [Bacteroidetes bacterium]|nr:ABC transporter permease [Bacteroidota bacterium]
MNVALYIAKRYFVAKKSTQAITIISWISVLSIAVGTAALVIILSGMNGLTSLVKTLYNSFNPDIKITATTGKIFLADEKLLSQLQHINGVTFVCKTVEDNMLLKYRDQLQITKVKGVDTHFKAATHFDTLITNGSYFLEKNNQLLMGRGVAYRLGVALEDMFTPISVYCPKRGANSSINPEDAFNEEKCYPSGFFSINDDFDFSYVLTSYQTALSLLEYPDGSVSALEVSLKPGTDAAFVMQKIKENTQNKFVIKNKYQQNDVLFKTLQTEKLWTFIILAFVLLIATFNIIGALTMLILEKKNDIQTLSALGADTMLIRKIFMAEGLMIIFIGAAIGLFLGYLLCLLQQQYGFVTFEEGFAVSSYPIKMYASDFALIITTVLLIGFIAAFYPIKVFTKKKEALNKV